AQAPTLGWINLPPRVTRCRSHRQPVASRKGPLHAPLHRKQTLLVLVASAVDGDARVRHSIRGNGDPALSAGHQGARPEGFPEREGAVLDGWRCEGVGEPRDHRVPRGKISRKSDLAQGSESAGPRARRSRSEERRVAKE